MFRNALGGAGLRVGVTFNEKKRVAKVYGF